MYIITPVAWVRAGTGVPGDRTASDDIMSVTLDDRMPDDSLQGIEDFSHLEILFYFHETDPANINPGLGHPRNNPAFPKVGVFSRRGPDRPNQLGLTRVELIRRDGRTLYVKGLDAFDGSPVIDIKPLLRSLLPRDPISQPKLADEISSRGRE